LAARQRTPTDCLNVKSTRSTWCKKAELNGHVDSDPQPRRLLEGHMYYIGLDVHKKTISYCVKDASGRICQEGKVGATRWELDIWIKTLPQPWTVAMEATIFTGWIYDHLITRLQRTEGAIIRSLQRDPLLAERVRRLADDSRRWQGHSAELGTRDGRYFTFPVDPTGHQLLWALRR
jgi:hypothetical protein